MHAWASSLPVCITHHYIYITCAHAFCNTWQLAGIKNRRQAINELINGYVL